jgi:hypothetical protein
LIYDAGDARTTWISFWKAVALLQCGTTLVFAVPPLWKNENQPDPNLRKAQAILGTYYVSQVIGNFTHIFSYHLNVIVQSFLSFHSLSPTKKNQNGSIASFQHVEL